MTHLGVLIRNELCKIGETLYLSTSQNCWFGGDSCVTCAINNDDSGMFDFRFISDKITGIGGHSVTATKVGKKKVLFVQSNRNMTEQIISPTKYCQNEKITGIGGHSVTATKVDKKKVLFV